MREYVFALEDETKVKIQFELNSYQIRKIEEFIAYSHNVDIEYITWWIEE